eukprot:TRINITY_DN125279_c0_g1_i1.p1 TRINITY_DN125279_c0_g1~~TRINITY_DN125279_c0_g1_i1.p1  ORF type:complete len:216 (+),score=13.59 TRINITY_DN125279_c0_g1_i1:65-712(+)
MVCLSRVHLSLMYAVGPGIASLASDIDQVCRGPSGAEQACEDFTYVGSLVENLPPDLQMQEALDVYSSLQAIPSPSGEAMSACNPELLEWIGKASAYLQTGAYSAQEIVPLQNYVMGNHQTVAAECPGAWLMTLLLKIDSNLERGHRGQTCARVHAAGCIRDGRGYWRLYLDARTQFASTKQAQDSELAFVAEVAEARIKERFAVALGQDMRSEL